MRTRDLKRLGPEISKNLSDSEREELFNKFNLPWDIIFTGIENLQISGNLKNTLFEIGVWNLFDLLILDYRDIEVEKYLGEKYLRELKDYVHGLGFTLKNERLFLNEILDQKRKDGVRLLEDYGLSSRVYLTLYFHNIYSFGDVLRYGPKINNITSFGPLRRQELAAKMEELGISFEIPEENIDDTVARLPYDSEASEKKIAELAAKDQHVSELMEKRRLLVSQLNELENEQDRLNKRLEEIEFERSQIVKSFLER